MDVEYRFAATTSGCAEYVNQLLAFPDATFDFIMVDGSCRDPCISLASVKVKPGGIIVVDNADECHDLSPLHGGFARYSTDNGVWRTDIYTRLAREH